MRLPQLIEHTLAPANKPSQLPRRRKSDGDQREHAPCGPCVKGGRKCPTSTIEKSRADGVGVVQDHQLDRKTRSIGRPVRRHNIIPSLMFLTGPSQRGRCVGSLFHKLLLQYSSFCKGRRTEERLLINSSPLADYLSASSYPQEYTWVILSCVGHCVDRVPVRPSNRRGGSSIPTRRSGMPWRLDVRGKI